MTVESEKERLDDFHQRAYDFFKHLTGVSLFTAATMVSSSDPDKGRQMSSRSVHLSLGVAVWSLCLGLGAAIQTFSTLLM